MEALLDQFADSERALVDPLKQSKIGLRQSWRQLVKSMTAICVGEQLAQIVQLANNPTKPGLLVVKQKQGEIRKVLTSRLPY
jgi:hypothetical protein